MGIKKSYASSSLSGYSAKRVYNGCTNLYFIPCRPPPFMLPTVGSSQTDTGCCPPEYAFGPYYFNNDPNQPYYTTMSGLRCCCNSDKTSQVPCSNS